MNGADKPLTYGIIGVGLMGIEHIRNLQAIPGTKITCIADNYAPSIESCLPILASETDETTRTVETFTSAKELFESKLCEVAIISTPNHTHYEILKDAYEYGDERLHILVEKPMCTTIKDCREVIAMGKKRIGKTYVGLEYSYMPAISRVITEANSGHIGKIQMVAIREHRFPFLEKVRNWNRFNNNSGGTFVEKCCHFFDLFNRIMAPCVPKAVMASGGQDVNHLNEIYDGKKCDIFDNGYVIVEYSDGRRACLDLCMFAEASHSQEEVCVVGDKGKVEAFLPQGELRIGIRGRESCGDVLHSVVTDERIAYAGHHHGSSFLEHLDIVKSVRAHDGRLVGGGGAGTAGLYQGLLSVAIGVAAHLSIEEGRIVGVEELLTREEIQGGKYA